MPAAGTEGYSFSSRPLDDMHCGTLELSVPLRGDVIQVGVGGDLDVGRIRVRKDPWAVTVVRVDGQPMQVAVVVEHPRTAPVFDAPVAELRFVLVDDGARGPCWHPVSGAGARPEAIKQVADVVGTFAVAKQQRGQHLQPG